jgi:hypothetical protein
MAPTPADTDLSAGPTSTSKPASPYWTTANITFTAIASVLTFGVLLGAVAFFVHRRRQQAKVARMASDKAGLLSGEDRKSNMFSRERSSSVTVYVDSEADNSYKGAGHEPAPLVPLHIATPYSDSGRPVVSTGSGVSSISRSSRASSGSSVGSQHLSPISDMEDINMGPSHSGRPRSTSSSSVRYYSKTATNSTVPVPKIVHTMSD